MPTTTVIDINEANRGPGDFTFNAPAPVPAGIEYATFDVTLTDADLLTLGRVIVVEFRFSPDGVQPYVRANKTTWHSYGPNGLTVTYPGNPPVVRVNPGPRIQLQLIDRAGQFLQGFLSLNLRMRCGVIISITTT